MRRDAIELRDWISKMKNFFPHTRSKRQTTTTITCAEIPAALARLDSQKTSIDNNIAASNETLARINVKIVQYTNLVSTTMGQTRINNQNLLNTYQRMAATTASNIDRLRQQKEAVENNIISLKTQALACNTSSVGPTVPTTTTTTGTTTTLSPSDALPCGAFAPYDPVNDPLAPERNGFAGGVIYKAGEDYSTYVGYGNYDTGACADQGAVASFISTKAGEEGAYIPCTNLLFNDTKNAYYLLNHPDLEWVSTTDQDMNDVPGILKISGLHRFYFGRRMYNGKMLLGKVNTDLPCFLCNINYFWQWTVDGEKGYKDFEVLTCKQRTSIPSAPVEPRGDIPCGTYVQYFPTAFPTGPEIYGFKSGEIFETGENYSTYAGYGTYNGLACAGYPIPSVISTFPEEEGAYLPCGGSRLKDTDSVYYVLNHPNLQYVRTNIDDVNNVAGALRISGYTTQDFMFGRFQYKNKTIGGKINIDSWPGFWAWTVDGEIGNKYNFEVLVCQPNPVPTTTTTTIAPPITTTQATTTPSGSGGVPWNFWRWLWGIVVNIYSFIRDNILLPLLPPLPPIAWPDVTVPTLPTLPPITLPTLPPITLPTLAPISIPTLPPPPITLPPLW